jgi:hypothetical protein
MCRLVGFVALTFSLSTAAFAQNNSPLSAESKAIMDKLRNQSIEANVLAQCLPGLTMCPGGGSHGTGMSVCCPGSATCGQSSDGIPYCR